MTFHVGQRVVCVEAHWWPNCAQPPVKGRVYTVRNIPLDPPTNTLGLRFEELFNPHVDALGGEWGFKAHYFRPLDERRLDVFRAMLAPKPKQPVEVA